jgi:D-alanyl-D-alanine dipeptidase
MQNFFLKLLCAISLSFLSFQAFAKPQKSTLTPDFTYLENVAPTIIQEMRYAGFHNFIGKPLPGYLSAKCILTVETAKALAKVQAELKKSSLSLKVYDCYRPKKAVNYFMRWADDLDDVKMKEEFYPQVEKSDLFKEGYIAKKSRHSAGGTVDLTIVELPAKDQPEYNEGDKLTACTLPADQRFADNSLDFGTGYDCFDTLSNTQNEHISDAQKERRLLLKSIMEKHGFKNVAVEWWHYTFTREKFPNSYFDFDVK